MNCSLTQWFLSGQPNMRLLLSRFTLVGKERSPCGSRSRSTSIAAQQNR